MKARTPHAPTPPEHDELNEAMDLIRAMIAMPRVARLIAYASTHGAKATRKQMVTEARKGMNPYDTASAKAGMQRAIASAAVLDEILGDCAKVVAVIANNLDPDTFHYTMSMQAQLEELSDTRAKKRKKDERKG